MRSPITATATRAVMTMGHMTGPPFIKYSTRMLASITLYFRCRMISLLSGCLASRGPQAITGKGRLRDLVFNLPGGDSSQFINEVFLIKPRLIGVDRWKLISCLRVMRGIPVQSEGTGTVL